MSKPRKVGRDATTGQFIPVKVAREKPDTTTVETVRVPRKPPKRRTR